MFVNVKGGGCARSGVIRDSCRRWVGGDSSCQIRWEGTEEGVEGEIGLAVRRTEEGGIGGKGQICSNLEILLQAHMHYFHTYRMLNTSMPLHAALPTCLAGWELAAYLTQLLTVHAVNPPQQGKPAARAAACWPRGSSRSTVLRQLLCYTPPVVASDTHIPRLFIAAPDVSSRGVASCAVGAI